MNLHSKFSPSAAHRWLNCPASMWLEQDLPDVGNSAHAELGTAAHFLAAECLMHEQNADEVLNCWIGIQAHVAYWLDPDVDANPKRYRVDLEMATNTQAYLDAVRSQAEGNQLLVEQRVDFSEFTGQPNSFGTADAIVLTPTEIQVHDLKYGQGVRVSADNNEQLKLYALGAIQEYSLLGDFSQVRMLIHQPRLGAVSEEVMQLDELLAWGEAVKRAVVGIVGLNAGLDSGEIGLDELSNHAKPSIKACHWCKAKASCIAAERQHLQSIIGEFDDVKQIELVPAIEAAIADVPNADNARLSRLYAASTLIRNWLDAVDEAVYSKMLAGENIPDFKLVAGRKGARKWADDAQAEAMLKSMRLKVDEMYDLKLISPTTAEKLKKSEVIGPRQWAKVEALFVQSAAKPAVVPVSDKRPALDVNPINDFDNIA